MVFNEGHIADSLGLDKDVCTYWLLVSVKTIHSETLSLIRSCVHCSQHVNEPLIGEMFELPVL